MSNCKCPKCGKSKYCEVYKTPNKKDKEIAFLIDIAATRFEHMKTQATQIAELKDRITNLEKELDWIYS